MTHSFFIYFARFCVFGAVVIFTTVPLAERAMAQDCDVISELIFELSPQQTGSYTIWDASHGDMAFEERYKSGILSDDVFVVAAGERYVQEGKSVSLILHKLEKRGRLVWEKEHKVLGLRSVLKILPHAEGFLVAGTAAKKEPEGMTDIWLGFFGPEGELLKQTRISRAQESLDLQEIMPVPGKNQFLLATYVRSYGSDKGFARIYKIDGAAKVMTERAFNPGVENKIIGIAQVKPEQFAASGYLWSEDGRRAGWLMSLDQDLAIRWEQQYPRGLGAKLSHVMGFISDTMVVAGDTVPYGDGNRAGWVMAVEQETGKPAWQRYYSGDMHYDAIDGLISDDGLISILMTAKKPNGEAHHDKIDYTRLLTINPRGVLFISDEYFNGKGADAPQVFFGAHQERILVGGAIIDHQIKGPDGDPPKTKRSLDAWVAAATAMERYKDPCIQPKPYMP
jgi:hypothetical protein